MLEKFPKTKADDTFNADTERHNNKQGESLKKRNHNCTSTISHWNFCRLLCTFLRARTLSEYKLCKNSFSLTFTFTFRKKVFGIIYCDRMKQQLDQRLMWERVFRKWNIEAKDFYFPEAKDFSRAMFQLRLNTMNLINSLKHSLPCYFVVLSFGNLKRKWVAFIASAKRSLLQRRYLWERGRKAFPLDLLSDNDLPTMKIREIYRSSRSVMTNRKTALPKTGPTSNSSFSNEFCMRETSQRRQNLSGVVKFELFIYRALPKHEKEFYDSHRGL